MLKETSYELEVLFLVTLDVNTTSVSFESCFDCSSGPKTMDGWHVIARVFHCVDWTD